MLRFYARARVTSVTHDMAFPLLLRAGASAGASACACARATALLALAVALPRVVAAVIALAAANTAGVARVAGLHVGLHPLVRLGDALVDHLLEILGLLLRRDRDDDALRVLLRGRLAALAP